MGVGFSGWSTEVVEFFKGLQINNSKAYWSARKAFYEASVREPVAELLGELSGEFGPGRIRDRTVLSDGHRADLRPWSSPVDAPVRMVFGEPIAVTQAENPTRADLVTLTSRVVNASDRLGGVPIAPDDCD